MKVKKFLLSVTLLFSSVTLTSATINQASKTNNAARAFSSAPLKLNQSIGDDVPAIINTDNDLLYYDIQTAINESTALHRHLRLLRDVVAPGAIEARTSSDPLANVLTFPTDHRVYISGAIEGTEQDRCFTLDGYGFKLDGPASHLELSYINIKGEKENADCNGNLFYLNNGATLVFDKNTKVYDFKTHAAGVINTRNTTVGAQQEINITINDGAKFTDCAAKYGLFYMHTYVHLVMNGGEICYNRSTNKSTDNYREGVAVYLNGATFDMYGGSIHDNDAHRWDVPSQINSNGTIYLASFENSVRPAQFNMYGGEIYNNTVARGGVAYVYLDTVTCALPKICVGGKVTAIGNYGASFGEGVQSNFYLSENGDCIEIDTNHPLDESSKIGVFTGESIEIGEYSNLPVAKNATSTDISKFVSDDYKYSVSTQPGKTESDLYLFHCDDPVFTAPTLNNNLAFDGSMHKLIKTPGKVTTGGTLLYSLNNGDKEIDTWTDDPDDIVAKDAGDYVVYYYVTKSESTYETNVEHLETKIGKKIVTEIIWPEDNFVNTGTAQSIVPTMIGTDGKIIELGVHIYIEGDRSKEVEFKDPTKAPDKRYEVVAYSKDPNYQVSDDVAVKYYTMKVTEKEVQKEIEVLPDGKPIVKVECETGFDSWTKLVAKKVDSNDKEEEQQYKETSEDLTKSNNLTGDDAISAVYDVKLLKDNIEIQPDGTLKIYFALPDSISSNNNISIFHIHENGDGTKEITEMKHEYTEDGYASVITDTLSSFVIVHHQTSLLWLIITISVLNVGLIVGIVLVAKKKKTIKVRGGKK